MARKALNFTREVTNGHHERATKYERIQSKIANFEKEIIRISGGWSLNFNRAWVSLDFWNHSLVREKRESLLVVYAKLLGIISSAFLLRAVIFLRALSLLVGIYRILVTIADFWNRSSTNRLIIYLLPNL